MILEIITEHEVSRKAKVLYPMISLIGVISELTQINIFPQRKSITDLFKKTMLI